MTDTDLAQGYVAGSFCSKFFFRIFFKNNEPATRRWARNERWERNKTLWARNEGMVNLYGTDRFSDAAFVVQTNPIIDYNSGTICDKNRRLAVYAYMHIHI